VIIDDNTGPSADVISLSDIISECSITSLTAPTATDNCAGTISGTHNATLPITTQGTTVVTWTYDDGNGNITTQNQHVIINQIDNSVSFNITTLTATATGYTYQWIDCGNGNTPIAGETNQSYTATVNGSYAVEISNGSCSVTSDCITIAPFALAEILNTPVILYPNPNRGQFQIDLGKWYESVGVTIYSVSGQIISKEKYTSMSILEFNLNYPYGVYYVEIECSGKDITRHKIVLEN
jgi:hypothetical protein